jgi:hypothetical protein
MRLTPVASSPARQLPHPFLPPLEEIIGQITASAAWGLARGLSEREHGGLQLTTKMHAGELIALLFSLKQAYTGASDFYAVARAEGVQALTRRCSGAADARTIAILVDGVIEVLQKVVRSQLN